MPFDRTKYFDTIRESVFGGSMTQEQVDGQEAILTRFEQYCEPQDHRWLAYELATVYHECATRMVPVKEYGSDSYLQSKPYYPYVGRGLVQLTWDYNYDSMGQMIGCNLMGSNMDLALTDDPTTTPPYIASTIMFEGMCRGSFRPPNNLSAFFNENTEDPVGARAIINADVSTIGPVVAGYYMDFKIALEASYVVTPPSPEPPPTELETTTISITAPKGTVKVTIAPA